MSDCPNCKAPMVTGTVHLCRFDNHPIQRLQTVNPHSVELTLTSAGKIGASVKVYADNEGEAFERAAAILDQVTKRYPPKP